MVGHKDYTLGDLKWSIQNSDHDFWLKCDGRSLNRTLYPALFTLIGTNYGSDDSQTFKLPDCRGRVVGSIGSGSGLTPRSAGDKVGTETHTLTVQEMPTHSHTGTTDSSGTHTHTNNSVDGSLGLMTTNGLNTQGADVDNTPTEPNLYTASEALTINEAGEHTHTFTSNTTGNSLPHNNMQPTIFIGNVFIAYKTQNAY
jgi:microcystin-dependent protein